MSEGIPSRKPLHERSDSLTNSANNSASNSASTTTSNGSQNSLKNTSGPPRNDTSSNSNPNHSNIGGTGTGTNNAFAAIRLVPSTPPRLLGAVGEPRAVRTSNDDDASAGQHLTTTSISRPDLSEEAVYSRTPLPTHPSHILSAPGNSKDPAFLSEFRTNLQAQQHRKSSGSSAVPGSSTHKPPQLSRNVEPDTGSPIVKVRPPAKKLLHIHKDNKTFSLLQDDRDAQSADGSQSPLLSLSRASSYDSLASQARHAEGRSNSIESCLQYAPATPSPIGKQPISGDPISTSSPWNYTLVGGLRKVPKTPDLKQKAGSAPDRPLPPVPEVSDQPSGASHNLSTKHSFQSTQTTTSSISVSETSNYKVYQNTLASTSDIGLSPSTSDSNYQLIGPPSVAPSEATSELSETSPNYQLTGPPSEPSSSSNYEVIGPSSNVSTNSSVIHRPYTARSETISESENENYELYGEPSPTGSATNLLPPSPQPKYSQESLLVPPLKPRNRRSNEGFGYYKQRSRETLRTGSLTSITTVLSQQEASQAIVGSGSLVQIPVLNQRSAGSSSWAESSDINPPRSHMNEHPHQWSSQLSTVLSVSEGETGGRLSRDWASVSGRSSGAFPSTPSRSGSRQNVLSISSSLALDEARSESLEAPEPAFVRGSRRHQSSGSIPYVQDQDEYGDGITDMQDLRSRASRTRLSGFFASTGSESGRTNTIRSTRSTSSSRANSLIGTATLPTWARLYYGSGERRHLGAPGTSSESMNGSRASSFRSGSPNTDNFPLNIYSPRRRPRDGARGDTRPSTRGSLEIQPAPRQEDDRPYTPRRFRTWSMSSVWSPHLRMDRRATRPSAWDPPSVNWSADGSSFGRRNIQIIMFVTGFILPFAWMIAAFLPLPYNPVAEMREREADNSSSQLDTANEVSNANEYNRRFGPIDEKRFENAKWWRNLNRWMSLVGVFIIAAVVILAVVSSTQGLRSN